MGNAGVRFLHYFAEMRGLRAWWILSLVLLFLAVPHTQGWGIEGHYTVCKIAESYLSEEAAAAVKALLPDEAKGELAAACNWPDVVKRSPEYRWSSPLHFADTPEFKCDYHYCRDCHDSAGHKDVCVTGAINNYTMQLAKQHYDSVLSEAKQLDGSAYVSISLHWRSPSGHLIFFINAKPLHIGFIEDLGGTRILVDWYGTKTNLHHVWDDMIILSALETFYSANLSTMIRAIKENITDAFVDESSMHNCKPTACPDLYASESISSACKFAYPNATSGSTLGDDYFYSRWPIVVKRLAQGGVRLASLLNRIFSKHKLIRRESI